MPYEMTKAEWDEEWEKTKINFTGTGGYSGIYTGRLNKHEATGISQRQRFLKMGLISTEENYIRWHQVIKHALESCLDVPFNIQDEYLQL